MPSRVGIEHLRRALWSKLEDGSVRGTDLEPVVLAALRSTNVDWLQRVFRYTSVQDLKPIERGHSTFREPKPAQVAGEVLVGHSVPGGVPVRLRLSEFRSHVFLAGQSQSGKTTLARLIASQLVRSARVVVFDIEDEYAPLATQGSDWLLLPFRYWRRNHFVGPARVDPGEWLNQLATVLEEAFGITPLSASQMRGLASRMLERGQSLSWPTMLEALRHLSSRGASFKALYVRVLNLLAAYRDQFGVKVGFLPSDILQRSVVLGLKNLASDQRLFFYADLYSFHSAREDVKAATTLKGVWFFDEYHSLMDARWQGKEPLSFKMLRQISKRGTGLVVCEQSPVTLDARARTNYATRCFFGQRDRTNINYVADSLDLTQDQREAYKWLPPRHFVMQHPRVPFPFVVRVPESTLPRASSRQVDECVRATLGVLGFDKANVRDENGYSTGSQTRGHDEDVLSYLNGIAAYPEVPTTQRDKLLGLGTAKAAALRKRALDRGLIEQVRVNPGGRGKSYVGLKLTAKGQGLLGR